MTPTWMRRTLASPTPRSRLECGHPPHRTISRIAAKRSEAVDTMTIEWDHFRDIGEPFLQDEAIDGISELVVGSSVVWANARSGGHAACVPGVTLTIDPQPSNCRCGQVIQSTVGAIDVAAIPKSPVGQVAFRQASASATGLAACSVDTLVVDHAETEASPADLLAEALRVLKPGGRLLLIKYALPMDGPDDWDPAFQAVAFIANVPMRTLYPDLPPPKADKPTRLTGPNGATLVPREDLSLYDFMAQCSATQAELTVMLKNHEAEHVAQHPRGRMVMRAYFEALAAVWEPEDVRWLTFDTAIHVYNIVESENHSDRRLSAWPVDDRT